MNNSTGKHTREYYIEDSREVEALNKAIYKAIDKHKVSLIATIGILESVKASLVIEIQESQEE